MTILRRLYLVLLLAILTVAQLVFFVSPVFATIALPTTIAVTQVDVFQGCLEATDQLYFITYTVDYGGSNPATPISDNYLVRLMNGASELRAVAPFAYYDDGYGKGAAAIYFSAADVASKGMTWNNAGYSINLEGNPSVSWTGGVPPKVTSTVFDNWYASKGGYLSGTILAVASALEITWSVDLVQTTGNGTTLTTYGEDYFTNVIPNLAQMAPDIFEGSGSQAPIPGNRTHTQTYLTQLKNMWVGTHFDFSSGAPMLGIPASFIGAGLWLVFMGLIMYIITRACGNYRPAVPVMIPMVIFGGVLGFLSLLVAIVMTAIFGVITFFTLFYKPVA